MEFTGRFHEKIVGLRENELPVVFSVNENTADTRRTEVSEGIVLPAQASRENRVHEHRRERVGRGRYAVAKPFVDLPHLDSLWNFLVVAARFVLPLLPLVETVDVRDAEGSSNCADALKTASREYNNVYSRRFSISESVGENILQS